MLKLSEIFEFSSEKSWNLKEWIPRILTELRSEKFEWFGPSPIEPFNPALNGSPRVRRASARVRGLLLSISFARSAAASASAYVYSSFVSLTLGYFLATLRGPFSAVSKPIFSSKDSFESSRRDLQDLHVCVFWRKEPKLKMKYTSSNIIFFVSSPEFQNLNQDR